MEGKPEIESSAGAEAVVVGIGASAGGLEAFQDLFSRLGERHGMALVLVQHLDPDHDSLLGELLRNRVRCPVHTVTDGMEAAPGAIYLIPPNKSLTLEDGRLRLHAFDTPRGQRRPIDVFFESLAADAGERAAAIILSGTGSDGAQGVVAIKAAGGLVLAQDPRQSRYDGMPKSAIASGAVDLTLRTEEMVGVLDDFFQRRQGLEPAIRDDRDFVATVFKHLRYQTGHDFTHYKQATLLRRLSVRMSVLGISDPSEYVKRLIRDRDEAGRLFRDTLINVTSFFRDRAAWEAMAEQVIPELVADPGPHREVRIWVPGCSTGQEAYTLGILIAEELRRTDARPSVAIFGTDIDDDALQVARAGLYPNAIVDEVPADLLESYFDFSSGGYEVSKTLRNLVRFSHQSLIKDPPFSKLDLISCRNVTIYFEKKLQELAVSVFHYALKPGGLLFLGPSENLPEMRPRFEEVDPLSRIYRRDDAPARPLNLPVGPVARSLPRLGEADPQAPERKGVVRDAILSRHAPPYVVLTGEHAVTFASPGAERFLRVKPGDLRLEIGALIHPALDVAVRRLLNGTRSSEPGHVTAIDFSGEIDGREVALEITGERLPGDDMIIVFHSRIGGDALIQSRLTLDDAHREGYIRDLEQELDAARQTIRTTVEELETSNEELKSSNEQMMSMNEELQSANEELSTINEELQSKVGELNALNRDIISFVESSAVATVFLDPDFRLRRFTPEAKKLFRFQDADVGRPIDDIGSDLDTKALLEALREAQGQGASLAREFRTLDGRLEFLVRIVPHETGREGRRALVFSLIDVTELRRAVAGLEEERRRADASLEEVEELYRVSPVAMALFDRKLRYLRLNQQLALINGVPAEEHFGRSVYDIVPDVARTVAAQVTQVFETGESIAGIEIVGRTAAHPDEDRVWIVDYYPLRDEDGIRAVGVNARDVTQQRETQEELRRVMLELQHRVKNMLSNVTALINRARRDDRPPQVVLDVLARRIRALSDTHSLLTAANWRSTAIRDLVDQELVKVYGADVVAVRGPEVRLNARGTLGLGLILHELATNAAKYGALGQEGGTLALNWSRFDEGEGERLRLTWVETCPEPVTAPEREGFGTTLIRSTAENSLDGAVSFEWNPKGLRAVVEFDWVRATARDESVETGL